MSIQGKGRRIDNFGALQSQRGTSLRAGNIDNLVARLGLDTNKDQGRGDIAFGPNDELIYVYSVASSTGYGGASLYAIRSYDYGQTWSDPVEIKTEAGYGFKEPHIDYIQETRLWTIAATKVNDSDGEDCEIVVFTGGDILSEINEESVTQPFTKKNFVGGRIRKLNRDLFMPVFGFDTGESNDRPAIMRSTNGGQTWGVYHTFSYVGKARSVYTRFDDRVSNQGSYQRIFCIVGNNTDTNRGYLASTNNGSDWDKYMLPFVVNNSCDYVIEEDILTFFTETRSALGYNEISFHTVNGFDFTPAETLSGVIRSHRKVKASNSGGIFSAVNIHSDKPGRGDQIGLQNIILQNRSEIVDEINPTKEVIPRYTTVEADGSLESREVSTKKSNARVIIYSNSEPTEWGKIVLKVKWHYKPTVSIQSENITHLLTHEGDLSYVNLKLKSSIFSIEVVNNSDAEKSIAVYANVNDGGPKAGRSSDSESISVVQNDKFETNGVGRGIGNISNMSGDSGLQDAASNTHIGFHGSAVGRNGDLYIAYRSASTHSLAPGDVYITKSTDLGRTWATPILIYECSGEALQDVEMSYDFAADRYFIIYSEYSSIENDDSEINVLQCHVGDPMNPSNWNNRSVDQPYNNKNRAPYAPIRRSRDYLILSANGHDSGDSEQHPALLYSDDDGYTWKVGQTFTDVNANESTFYFKWCTADQKAQNFLLCRNNNVSGDGFVIISKDLLFDSYTVKESILKVAGGTNVLMMGDYFIAVGRNSEGTSGSMGYTSYSLDGYTWSEIEYNGFVFPVQAKFMKLNSGRVLVTSCVEPSQNFTDGNIVMSELFPPSYEEVLQKVISQNIQVFERYKDIPNEGAAESEFYHKTHGKSKVDIALRDDGGGDFLNGPDVKVELIIPFKSSQLSTGTTTIDVTDQLILNPNVVYGTVNVFGSYFKLKVTNQTGGEIRLQGFVRCV